MEPNSNVPCVVCGSAASFRCSKCKGVRYCSRTCQKVHWPQHKQACRVIDGPESQEPQSLDVPDARRRVTGIRALVVAYRDDDCSTSDQVPAGVPCQVPPAPVGTNKGGQLGTKPSQPTTKENSVGNLPDEMVWEVFKWLPADDLAVASIVCKQWQRLGCQDNLWQQHLQMKGFRISRPAPSPPAPDLVPPSSTFHPATAASLAVAGVRGIQSLRARPATPSSTTAAAAAAVRPPSLPPSSLHHQYCEQLRLESNWHKGRYVEHRLSEHSSTVECLAFQDTQQWGRVLVSAAWEGAVAVWQCGAEPQLVRRYTGHNGWVTSLATGYQRIVTASSDRHVCSWLLSSSSLDPEARLEQPMEATVVRWARQGVEDRVVSGCVDGCVRLWCLVSQQLLAVLQAHVDVVWGLHALPHDRLFSTSRDGGAAIWQLPAPGEKLPHGQGQGGAALIEPVAMMVEHSSAVLCADVYCPPGGDTAWPAGLAATGSADWTIRVWDTSACCSCAQLVGHQREVLAVRWGRLPRQSTASTPQPGGGGPSSQVVLVSGSVVEVIVWCVLSCAPLAYLRDHHGPVTALALHQDMLVSLAMGDGLIAYACHGLPATLGGGTTDQGTAVVPPPHSSSRARGRRGSRLRECVASAKCKQVFEPAVSLQDCAHCSLAAALAVCDGALALGCGNGDITLLDYNPTARAPWPPRTPASKTPALHRSHFMLRL